MTRARLSDVLAWLFAGIPILAVLGFLLALSALGGCQIGAGMMASGFKKEPCPNHQPCERK